MKKILSSILLSIALLSPSVQAMDFSYNQNNLTLTMVGDVVASDDMNFLRYVMTEEVKTVNLTSYGGNFLAGVNIGLMINEMKLDTVATDYCYSSCAYMWLAGTAKMYNIDVPTHIGIHMPAYETKKNISDKPLYLQVGFYIGKVTGNYPLAEYISKIPNSETGDFSPKDLYDLGVSVIPWNENYIRNGK